MKIKEQIDSYNVKSLSGIDTAVRKMRDRCDCMDMLGRALKNNIQVAKDDGYQDKNSEKAELIIDEYLKKLVACRHELDELSASVKKFIDKMEDIWDSWN